MRNLLNLGNAIALNGTNQNISFPVTSLANLDGVTSVSISMWIKANSVLATGSQYFLFTVGVSGGTSARFSFDLQALKLRLGARAADGASFLSLTSNSVVAKKGKWVHIGGSIDTVNDVIKLYSMGRKISVDTSQTFATFTTGSPPGAIRIGSSPADNNYSPVSIDEFKLYTNRVLTDVEFMKIRQGKEIDETRLVAYHKFETLSGTTLTDETGLTPGTIIGSPSLETGFSEARTAI